MSGLSNRLCQRLAQAKAELKQSEQQEEQIQYEERVIQEERQRKLTAHWVPRLQDYGIALFQDLDPLALGQLLGNDDLVDVPT
jgi:hypothetical protein